MRNQIKTHCVALAAIVVTTATVLLAGDLSTLSPTPSAIAAKRFALRVRTTSDSPEAAELMLWYTRDRGQTWQPGPFSVSGKDYIVFEAKSEGLYGFYITAKSATGSGTDRPVAGTQPQRWVYIDYTPPLAQWKNVELVCDAAGNRRVMMDWTAYDVNMEERPIAVAYQPAGQMQWRTISAALPNTGRYDWTPPSDVLGRVTFRLTVRDLGGHSVERLFGPISLDPVAAKVSESVTESPVAASRPVRRVGLASPQPKEVDLPEPEIIVDPASRVRAQKLYEQGVWHVERGQYAEAQERLLEALELDPTLLPARVDLAGVYYSRGNYGDSISQYQAALKKDGSRATALKGLALAFVAQRDYPEARKTLERLLQSDERNAEAWLNLGDVVYQMGDRDNARQFWNRAAGVSPDAREIVLKAQNRLSLFTPVAGPPNDGKGK